VFDLEVIGLIGGSAIAIIGGLLALWVKASKPQGNPDHKEPPSRSPATAEAAKSVVNDAAESRSGRIEKGREGKNPGKDLAGLTGALYPKDEE